MANESKFAHISVSVDDDDDYVIEAGVPAASVDVAPAVVLDELDVDRAPVAPVSPVTPEPAAAKPAAANFAAAESVAAKPALAKPAGADRQAKGYRETTLEDLEVEKMSGMQKGVIAAAFLAIVAFIVYLVL